MIYLLLGGDDFSKREFIVDLKKKLGAEVLDFFEFNGPLILQQAHSAGLFAQKKILKLNGLISSVPDADKFLSEIADSPDEIIFIEESLDKRKKETKALLADKRLKVLEFEVPVGPEFKKWVTDRAKKMDLQFAPKALDLFLTRIGLGQEDFGKPIYDLWQTEQELNKLKTFAGGKPVQAENVLALTAENLDENVFKITNAIADRDAKSSVKFITDYIERISGDDKTKVISLSAILAEQFRGILAVQSLLAQGAPDSKISAETSFSSGRLFVYKRLAQRFKTEKVREILRKFELLDEETKSSTNPAALQFFMIVNSIIQG